MTLLFLNLGTTELFIVLPLLAFMFYSLFHAATNMAISGTHRLIWGLLILASREGFVVLKSIMKCFCIAMLIASACACKKSEVDIVEKFVNEVKAERYEEITLPAFNASHIDALMQHAVDWLKRLGSRRQYGLPAGFGMMKAVADYLKL